MSPGSSGDAPSVKQSIQELRSRVSRCSRLMHGSCCPVATSLLASMTAACMALCAHVAASWGNHPASTCCSYLILLVPLVLSPLRLPWGTCASTARCRCCTSARWTTLKLSSVGISIHSVVGFKWIYYMATVSPCPVGTAFSVRNHNREGSYSPGLCVEAVSCQTILDRMHRIPIDLITEQLPVCQSESGSFFALMSTCPGNQRSC